MSENHVVKIVEEALSFGSKTPTVYIDFLNPEIIQGIYGFLELPEVRVYDVKSHLEPLYVEYKGQGVYIENAIHKPLPFDE